MGVTEDGELHGVSTHDTAHEQVGPDDLIARCRRLRASEVDFDRKLENSAAYLKGWAAKLRDEPKLLSWAASQAQKATDLVLAAGAA
jgi:antirestriction protein ArdC